MSLSTSSNFLKIALIVAWLAKPNVENESDVIWRSKELQWRKPNLLVGKKFRDQINGNKAFLLNTLSVSYSGGIIFLFGLLFFLIKKVSFGELKKWITTKLFEMGWLKKWTTAKLFEMGWEILIH